MYESKSKSLWQRAAALCAAAGSAGARPCPTKRWTGWISDFDEQRMQDACRRTAGRDGPRALLNSGMSGSNAVPRAVMRSHDGIARRQREAS